MLARTVYSVSFHPLPGSLLVQHFPIEWALFLLTIEEEERVAILYSDALAVLPQVVLNTVEEPLLYFLLLLFTR